MGDNRKDIIESIDNGVKGALEAIIRETPADVLANKIYEAVGFGEISYLIEKLACTQDTDTKKEVKCPQVYTHFKHNPDGSFNNYTYCTMGISKPMKPSDFEIVAFKCFNAVNTETEQTFSVFAIGNNLYHYEDSYKGELVIYKSLYDGRKPWARPVEEFLSKVPEGRESENPTGQVYRFEEVGLYE